MAETTANCRSQPPLKGTATVWPKSPGPSVARSSTCLSITRNLDISVRSPNFNGLIFFFNSLHGPSGTLPQARCGLKPISFETSV